MWTWTTAVSRRSAPSSRHPVIGCALDLVVEAINRGDTDILWLSTGPGLLTRAFARVITGSKLSWRRWLTGMAVLHRNALRRAVAIHCHTGHKKTDRYWSNTAFARRRKAAALADD